MLTGATVSEKKTSRVGGSSALMTLAQYEREHVEQRLDLMDGNKTLAAQSLGISLKTLYNKLGGYAADAKKGRG